MVDQRPRVMIIDDNEIDNLIHTRLLQDLGFSSQVQVFQNGKEALDYLLKCSKESPKQLPNLILMDLHMPLMDGFGFIEEFQNQGLNRFSDIKIIALSCSIYQKEVDDILAYKEVQDYLTKPLGKEKLMRLFEKVSI